MQKIPTLFVRDPDKRSLVLPEVNPGCEWVNEPGVLATRKWDGTSCLVREGHLYKRYDAKAGKPTPPDFEPAQPDSDPNTGHWPGWVPVGDGPEDRYHREAWAFYEGKLPDRTYELLGPKVQGNPEGLEGYRLYAHGHTGLRDVPTDFTGLKAYLEANPMEGIVFYSANPMHALALAAHPEIGIAPPTEIKMAKIKARDFGLPWPRKDSAK